MHLRLGVNIDHVATVRNARGGQHPCPIRAALLAEKAGADGITAHLREDRRHIRDDDIYRLKQEVNLPLNMEMAATKEMLAIALDVKPNACCIVPEKREELTTEGGLDVIQHEAYLQDYIAPLKQTGIRVSLFIDPDPEQVTTSQRIGADIVELHTGTYCDAITEAAQKHEFERIQHAAKIADESVIECHAGHGLDFIKARKIATIGNIVELNIGHFLMGEALFTGLGETIHAMRQHLNEIRSTD